MITSKHKAVYEECGEAMEFPFHWCDETILSHLVWLINNEKVQIINDTDYLFEDETEQHIICDVFLCNFMELGKTHMIYRGSSRTDANPVTTFKCVGEGFIYYLIGKQNSITHTEDMHVFYNDGNHFDIMKCRYICGGSVKNGIVSELLKTCREKSNMK